MPSSCLTGVPAAHEAGVLADMGWYGAAVDVRQAKSSVSQRGATNPMEETWNACVLLAPMRAMSRKAKLRLRSAGFLACQRGRYRFEQHCAAAGAGRIR